MKKHTFYILICFFALSSILFSSCLKDEDIEPTPLAGFTMINGYPDDLGVIFYADRQPIIPLEYKSFSGVALVTGNRNVIVKEYSSAQILADTSLVFQDSTFYSSFAFGTTEIPKHIITVDNAVQSLESSGVRFFNLSSGLASGVSLQVGDQTIPSQFMNRAVETQSSATANQGFIVQNSGTFTLSVRDQLGNTIATRESVKLDVKRYYSIILIGKLNNTTTPLSIGIIDQAVNE